MPRSYAVKLPLERLKAQSAPDLVLRGVALGSARSQAKRSHGAFPGSLLTPTDN